MPNLEFIKLNFHYQSLPNPNQKIFNSKYKCLVILNMIRHHLNFFILFFAFFPLHPFDLDAKLTPKYIINKED